MQELERCVDERDEARAQLAVVSEHRDQLLSDMASRLADDSSSFDAREREVKVRELGGCALVVGVTCRLGSPEAMLRSPHSRA